MAKKTQIKKFSFFFLFLIYIIYKSRRMHLSKHFFNWVHEFDFTNNSTKFGNIFMKFTTEECHSYKHQGQFHLAFKFMVELHYNISFITIYMNRRILNSHTEYKKNKKIWNKHTIYIWFCTYRCPTPGAFCQTNLSLLNIYATRT